MNPLPTGTITFLFTDIEGSTQLWKHSPQAMKAALVRHDALLRAHIEANQGYVFKTVGDAFCAAFASAPDALTAALAAQRALHHQVWPPEIGKIGIRAALHTGTADERNGDYFGPPLHRVARLLSAAHGKQTLLSLATQELVRDSLPRTASLVDLGEHRLKDVFRPEHVFQVNAPDLPSEFPPLKTQDAKLTNLPAQPTQFIGREREVAAILSLLRRDDVRLVTLTGPGGTGKTRLSLQAADLLDEYEHGVFFAALATITDPDLVIPTIASIFDVKESGGLPIDVLLKQYLAEKHLLLVLDHLEQVVSAAPKIGELLSAAPKLKIIASSREKLGIDGEHEYPVPPLGLRDLNQKSTQAGPSQYEAITLFIQRAKAANPNFEISEATAQAVAEICVLLDGLPLAIELAAARSKQLTAPSMLERLSSRLKALTGGARDLSARQQTMRGTIDWSYNLLDEGEKLLFARLGVFVGGWTLEAAEAVGGSVLPGGSVPSAERLSMDVFAGLESLMDKSLIRQTESAGGEARFMMLETIREYAAEKLSESAEIEQIRDWHLGYFLALAHKIEPELTRQNQVAWIRRLDDDLDNIRAALDWSLIRNNEAGIQLAGSLKWFWVYHFRDGLGWLHQLLRLPDLPLSLRAVALNLHLFLESYQGRSQRQNEDLAQADESLTLNRDLGDMRGIAHSQFLKGWQIALGPDRAYGLSLIAEGLDNFRKINDKLAIAEILMVLGNVLDAEGKSAQAHLDESLRLSRELGHLPFIVGDLIGLGQLAVRNGDFSLARLRLEEASEIQDMLGRQNISLMAILGQVAMRLGDYQQARDYFEEAITLGNEEGQNWVNYWIFVQEGYAALRAKDAESADRILKESLIRFQAQESQDGVAFSLEGLASLATLEDQPERALRLFAFTDMLREKMDVPRPPVEQADVDRDLATIRTQIDNAAFATAQAAGRAMTMDEAIAYALETPNP